MTSNLNDIAYFVNEKINIEELNDLNYISTENMLPDRGGITKSSGLPNANYTQYFSEGDILLSNIRPYFKKIWYATFNGGCSNDVLVLRAKSNMYSKFLYYVLSDDKFFEYDTATSKGTKMPRGDKVAIMKYGVPQYDLPKQKKIARVLSSLDDKIELNNKINQNLEQQLLVLFKCMFHEKISNNTTTNEIKSLSDIVQVIDNRGKTPPISDKQTPFPIIDVRALSGNGRIIDYNNCSKYVDETTYHNWFRSGHPKKYDILISTVGSLAEMKLFLANVGCIAQNVVALRCQLLSPLYLYQYLNYIKKDLTAYNIGSVQPSIKVSHILKHLIYIPTEQEIMQFENIATKNTELILIKYKENQSLIKLRNALLPKLMNGEIDVDKVEV